MASKEAPSPGRAISGTPAILGSKETEPGGGTEVQLRGWEMLCPSLASRPHA